MISFTASQSIALNVLEQPIPLQQYLRQPQRLIHALVDPNQVEALDEGVFRLRMRPLNFMMIRVQPVVDLQIWVDALGVLQLRSVGCEIAGNEYINQRFDLALVGYLDAETLDAARLLQGKADLQVWVDLPPAFSLTPMSLLEATGNGLLRGILATIKQRLARQLLVDYEQWCRSQVAVARRQPIASSRL